MDTILPSLSQNDMILFLFTVNGKQTWIRYAFDNTVKLEYEQFLEYVLNIFQYLSQDDLHEVTALANQLRQRTFNLYAIAHDLEKFTIPVSKMSNQDFCR